VTEDFNPTERTTTKPEGDLSYAEALKAIGRARYTAILPIVQPHDDLVIDAITQTKISTVVTAMLSVGRMPGDLRPSHFDEPIPYRRLGDKSLDWLEQYGIPARRDFAPFGAANYAWLFGHNSRLPVSEKDLGRFWGRFIHCLLIETQLLIAKQYYHGLGLYKQDVSFSVLSEALPAEIIAGLRRSSLQKIEFDQLHGRIFLEYCAVMIRAQWDKLTRLVCLVLGLSWNWKTVSKGLDAIGEWLGDQSECLHPWCGYHIRIFADIAEERLAEDGWLKGFRDPLLHDVGQHSAGVVAHKKSLETTSEMWDRVRDEHNWIREAMMAMLASFIGIGASESSGAE
jgi:hypothetical protein